MNSTSRLDSRKLARASGVKSTRLQRGVAAVEFAIVLPVLIIMLTIPVFFARVLMHYTVAAKAAQSATMFLSTLPLQEMQLGPRKTALAEVADTIAQTMTAELRPGGIDPVIIDVHCDGLTCGGPVAPKEIKVTVRMWMVDDYFPDLTRQYMADGYISVQYSSTMPYMGD